MMEHDALGAHLRDELGISEVTTARPVQAALTSALTFAIGAAMPLAMVLVSPADLLIWTVTIASQPSASPSLIPHNAVIIHHLDDDRSCWQTRHFIRGARP